MQGIANVIYIRGNETISINVNDSAIFYRDTTIEIDRERIFNYLETLFRITNRWQKEYYALDTIDGDSWELLINYNNGKIKKYTGHANYPNNFEALERLNQELVNEVF